VKLISDKKICWSIQHHRLCGDWIQWRSEGGQGGTSAPGRSTFGTPN